MIAGKHLERMLLKCLAVSVLFTSGCTGFLSPRYPFPADPVPPEAAPQPPRELDKVSLPPYIIEPPDILLIQAIKIVPKPPHRIEPFDIISVRVLGDLPDEPLDAAFAVGPDGNIDLGPSYGKLLVVGETLDEAQAKLTRHLQQFLAGAEVSVSLVGSAGAQQIAGEHLVGPDGRVNLGTYGSVYVAGLTLEDARNAIEDQLSETLLDPEVIVDIFSYNSKNYYVITEGAGNGDNVIRLPITGNETVLDALSNIGGLSQLSSKKLWISRPAPSGTGCAQVLPVDYVAITRDGVVATNYQLLPGDRLFIAEDRVLAFNSTISKYVAPFERLLGFLGLGTSTFNRINRFGLGQLN